MFSNIALSSAVTPGTASANHFDQAYVRSPVLLSGGKGARSPRSWPFGSQSDLSPSSLDGRYFGHTFQPVATNLLDVHQFNSRPNFECQL